MDRNYKTQGQWKERELELRQRIKMLIYFLEIRWLSLLYLKQAHILSNTILLTWEEVIELKCHLEIH